MAGLDVPPSVGVLRFGELALDLATGELRRARDAPPIALGTRPTRLLALLAWRHGRLVTRDQIQAAVWSDGTTVDFDQSINQHIRQLRQILGDDAARPTWIQTLPARGYRFLVSAELDRDPPTHAPRPAPATSAPDPVGEPRRHAADAVHGDSIGDSRVDSAAEAPRRTAEPAAREPRGDASVDAAAGPSRRAERAVGEPRANASDDPAAEAPRCTAEPATREPRGDASVDAAAGERRRTEQAVGRRVNASDDAAAEALRRAEQAVGELRGDASAAPPLGRSRRRRLIGAAGVVGALAVVLFATSISGNSAAVTAVRRADDGAAVRLAVLPFAADDAGDEARALGTTDELITALGEAYAVKLEVIALRTAMRYRASDAAPPAIARELGVDYLVDGRLRSQTGRLRIAVRLVRAADSAQLWARTFEQPAQGSWTIEAAIAQDVTAALGRVLLPHRAPPDAALDADSQQDYLRARYALRRGQPRRAAQTLAALTARVPRSAKAWAALALAELRTGPDRFAAAARAASTALELDPAHAEAHHVRAIVALYAEWDPERARRHLEAALATNPGIAEAHHDLAACYSAAGRHDDAIAAMQRALALDPRAPEVVSDVGWYYYFARHYADAALWCGRTLALEPTFYWAHRCIVMSRMRQGDRTAAVAAALDHLRARDAPPAILAAVQASDLAAYWRWELDARTDATNATDAADRAVAHLALGDRAAALDDLERAVATHRGWVLPFLSVDPTFDELRDQPRFQAVLHTIAAGAAL